MENSLLLVFSIYSMEHLKVLFWRNAQKGGIFLRVRFDLVIEFYGRSTYYTPRISPTPSSAEQMTLMHEKESIFPSQGLSISYVSSRHHKKFEDREQIDATDKKVQTFI